MKLSSVSGKQWVFKKYNTSDIDSYREKYSLSEIVAKLLSIRKANIEDVSMFLKPKIKNFLPNPLQLKDMQVAINRTYNNILKRGSIGIFGDYDVDGATSAAIISSYLEYCGLTTFIHIPDRFLEGYGPNEDALKGLYKKGAELIITVDCGISSFEPLKAMSSVNIDLIVLFKYE